MTLEGGFAPVKRGDAGGVLGVLTLVALFTVWFLATVAVLCVMEVRGVLESLGLGVVRDGC